MGKINEDELKELFIEIKKIIPQHLIKYIQNITN